MSESLPIPSDDRIAALSRMLEANYKAASCQARYIPIKKVLSLIGSAGVIGMMFVSPGAASVGRVMLDAHDKERETERKKHNDYYLRRAIRRLHEQKMVEIEDDGHTQTIMLTDAGKRRILKYALNELAIAVPKRWDGRWRMIIYDVDERKKKLRDVFRETLKALGFYKLQGSTWIYPYPCEEQVTFLREYYGVGNEVLYVVASHLEDDAPYRSYFGLDE